MQDCKVKFYWLVPTDLKRCLYAILYSKGTYLHSLPPATSIPLKYQHQIQDLIRKEDVLTMTLSIYYIPIL